MLARVLYFIDPCHRLFYSTITIENNGMALNCVEFVQINIIKEPLTY